MGDRFESKRRAIENAVLRGPGYVPVAQRAAAARGGEELAEELRAYVHKVQNHAYKVSDDEMAALRRRYTDDEIFEVTVAAALGAAMKRLDAGLAALEEACASKS